MLSKVKKGTASLAVAESVHHLFIVVMRNLDSQA
jgi:hypothetical protein